MANIFQQIAHIASIAPDVTKAVADGEQLLADVDLLQNDPDIQAVIQANPDAKAAVARISAEIRTIENDISKIKSDLKF